MEVEMAIIPRRLALSRDFVYHNFSTIFPIA